MTEETKCQCCGKEGVKRRRQGSAYPDDELNFAVLCDECQTEANEHWVDMWDEYYTMVM